MSLSEIKEKLYKKEAEDDLSKHGTSEFNPETNETQTKPGNEEKDLWMEKGKGLNEEEKKAVKKGVWAFGIIFFIIFAVVAGYFVRRWMFSAGGVYISVSGPEQADSGRLLTYEIEYKNDNWVDMKNVTLRIGHPESFKPESNSNFKKESPTAGSFDLGTIKSKSAGKIVFNGKAYSPKGALIYLKADLVYQPTGFSGKFEAKAQKGINVISAPIVLEIEAPQNIPSGDAIDYLVTCRNDGAESFPGLKIKIDYPEQFTFSNSNPKPSEGNNMWDIGTLGSGEAKKIVVSGKLEGEMDKIKSVRAYSMISQDGQMVVLNEEGADTKIVSSPFLINQVAEGIENMSADAGDTLQFKIAFKNNSANGLRDVIVTEKIDSPVLDYASLNMKGGSFDIDTKTITWKAPDVMSLKNLGPREEGMVSFSIKVKEIINVVNEGDKDFVIASLAKIDSPDVPTPISMNKIVSSNAMNIKLNSKLLLEAKGYYNDQSISNSGPVPPKVGQETTYTIHWKVANICNDISGAKVESILPTGVKMTGKFYPENAKITYNERNNTIVWDIGDIAAGTGVLREALEASFQVMIKPAPAQTGREVPLTGISTFSAKDDFTGNNLQKTAAPKNTNLREDAALTGEGKVAAE